MIAMRAKRWLWALAFVVVTAGVAAAGIKAGSNVTIRVMSAKVMKGPKFIGPTSGSLSRGDQLTVKEVKGDWYRVEGAVKGWVHKTNVVEGKVALSTKPGSGGSGASRDEVELAGRGFTPQIEEQYRNGNPDLDFSHVDNIEKASIDPGELQAFVESGELGGGQ
jgi:hypothetical protein